MPDIEQFEETSADLLRLVIETGRIGLWKLDTQTGKAWRNQRHDEIFGYPQPLPEWRYEMFLEHVVEEHRARVDALQRSAIENGDEWRFECPIIRADGQRRWISAAGRPIASENDNPPTLIGHVIDITDVKANEDRLSMVSRELNHRILNMLTTVKALIGFSARNANDVDDLVEKLTGRVGALARTHATLVSDDNEQLSLVQLLEQELEAFGGLQDRLVRDVEEGIFLKSSLIQPMALILHELLTNAIKYGALSNADGQILVTARQDERQISIEWNEQGGPPVASGQEKGFGMRVIAGALGQYGSVKMNFLPSGLFCEITLVRS